jgi:phage baseplate assembly protein W
MAVNRIKDPVLLLSDLDMDLTINPLTKDVSSVTGENTVKQALKNLLRFRKYDKPFHPEVDAGVMDLLFEPANPIVIFQIKRKIVETINSYESRVRGLQVDIVDLSEENAYRIDVQFQIQNSVETYRTTVIVERIR